MSTQLNQYIIWGKNLPYRWHKEWEAANGKDFYNHFESYMSDSAFDSKIVHKEGIFCLFDGRDGGYIIIGRVMAKCGDHQWLGEKPMDLPVFPTDTEKEFIQSAVERVFGLECCASDFQLWLVTHLR